MVFTGKKMLCVVVALAAGGCQEPPAKKKKQVAAKPGANVAAAGGVTPDMTLATVGATTITVGDFQKEIDRQAPHIRARYRSSKNMKTLLDAMVRFEVLAQEANRRGFDKDQEVIRTMKQAMVDRLYRQEFEGKSVEPSEDEIKAFYEANPDVYAKPERMRAAAIVIKSGARAKRIAKKALSLDKVDNTGFRLLVEQYGQDKDLAARGGDLGFFDRDTDAVPKAVVKAVFALAADGDIAGPIKVGSRYYIVKRTASRPSVTISLTSATPRIRRHLMRKSRRERESTFLEGLRKKATIKTFPDRLKAVTINTSKGGKNN